MSGYSEYAIKCFRVFLLLFLMTGCSQTRINGESVVPNITTPVPSVERRSTNSPPPSPVPALTAQLFRTTCPTPLPVSPQPALPPQALIGSPDQRAWAYIDFLTTSVEEAAQARQPLATGFLAILDAESGQLEQRKDIAVATRGGLVWALDGSQIYFIQGDAPGALAAYDLATATIQTLSVPPEQKEHILYTGDLILLPNQRLVYARLISQTPDWRGGRLELWTFDLHTRNEQRMLDIFDAPAYRGGPHPTSLSLPMTSSSDGTRIAFILGNDVDPNWSLSEQQGLYVIDLAKHTSRQIASHKGAQELAWSPDDQYLAVAFSTGDGADLWLYEFAPERVRPLSKKNWAVIQAVANPRSQALNALKFHTLKWIGNDRLAFTVRTGAAGNDFLDQRTSVLVYNVVDDEVQPITR